MHWKLPPNIKIYEALGAVAGGWIELVNEFNGRRLTVNEARPREERAPRQYSDNGGGHQSNW